MDSVGVLGGTAERRAVYSGISCFLAGFHENSYCPNAFCPKGGFQACLAC